jgi:hypothetical protein
MRLKIDFRGRCARVVLALKTAWCSTQDYRRVHERSTSSNEDGLGDVSKRRFFLQAFSKGGRARLLRSALNEIKNECGRADAGSACRHDRGRG